MKRVLVAAAFALATCWAAAALGGLDALRACAAICAALAALVVCGTLPRRFTPYRPRYGVNRTVVRHPHPRAHQLATTVGSALWDRRYYERVLVPLTQHIDADLPEAATAERAELAGIVEEIERNGKRSWR